MKMEGLIKDYWDNMKLFSHTKLDIRTTEIQYDRTTSISSVYRQFKLHNRLFFCSY